MKARSALPLALLLGSLAACHQAPGANGQAAPTFKPGVIVSGGRLVLPAVNGNPGAVYFTVTNQGGTPATLAGATVEGTKKAEFHETVDGTMNTLGTILVGNGRSVLFSPGGKHVMVFGLTPGLKSGGSTEITLDFTDGDKASAPLKIEAAGSSAAMAGMGM